MTYQGEHTVTTHLTEKGAFRAAILDIMDFLGLEDGDDRHDRSGEFELVTDHTAIHEMEGKELHHLFRVYAEETWDNDQQYSIEICTSSLQA
jgi:hypothetical protein